MSLPQISLTRPGSAAYAATPANPLSDDSFHDCQSKTQRVDPIGTAVYLGAFEYG